MEFSQREISDLAAFFSKRFPSYEQRAALAEAAGLAGDAQLTGDALAAWTDVIEVAVRKRRILDLVERARQQRPDDDNLRAMAEVFGAGGRWRRRRWGLVAAGAVAAAAGLLIWSPWLGDAPPELPPPDAPALAAATIPPSARPSARAAAGKTHPELDAALHAESLSVETSGDGELPVETDGLAEVAIEAEIEAPPVRSGPAPELPPRGPRTRRGCDGEPDEIVGYWFSGEAAPGGVGDVYTVDGGVNVREELPSGANGYSLTPVVCTLGGGWQVRIGLEPVLISGGAYWVPFRPKDLVRR
jgi:hypothetical protein